MTPSDQELIALIRAQDTDAFEILSLRYRELIYRHVLHTVRDNDAAEDVVQEVFLRIWTRAEQWNGRGTFKAWLFRIATNLALNYLRALKRRKQQPLELPADPIDTEDESCLPSWMVDTAYPGPECALEQAEQGELLQRLVNGLPEEKRTVFRMVHGAEMETRQVAQALGIPEGTVKSRLHYANRRLAREWRDLAKEWEEMA
ncbi:MAG: sigma-70 family RNA polymerase sigma factor [Chloroflexota bacterium]|nr:sigma-70 family RNA polymerase sigma factor [Chloroflexota bacterium]